MKLFLSILVGFFSVYVSFGQTVTITELDSSSIQKLKPESFVYFNASVESSLVVNETTNVLVDFSMTDAKLLTDSVSIKWGTDTFFISGLKPFLIKNVSSDGELMIESFQHGRALNFGKRNEASQKYKIDFREKPVFEKDEMVFGILAIVLGLIFFTSHKQSGFWKKFYGVVPALLLCYIVPAFLVFFGLISAEYSGLYTMAKNYLLPAALVLMTLGIDFKAIFNLGPKALIMFFVGTLGVVLGGPIAILVYKNIDPSVVGGEGYEASWRGLATIAGSWIGGGANQNAMYETYKYAPNLYGKMIVVDIVVANMWMAFLLWAAARAKKFDKWLKADTKEIDNLVERVSNYQALNTRAASVTDYMVLLAIAFGLVAFSHWAGTFVAGFIGDKFGSESPFAEPFLWLVVLATTGGLLFSITKLRKFDGAGASKIGSVFIYILVASIGMKMELAEAVKEPQLILVGVIWMIVHAGIMFLVAKLIKAPLFFLAVGSKANIGGAASAPVVAAAFHPALTSVGALLAILGYAVGTYGGIACAMLMEMVAP